jgi:hypothetical protein
MPRECVFIALSSVQCACVISSSLARPPLQDFPTFSHERHDFRKKVIEYEMSVLVSSTTFVRNISHSKNK